MIGARDDQENDVSDIIRVACQAAILLIDKYSTFANNCDIYLIAIGIYFSYFNSLSYSIFLVMCPDRKLKWFKDHGRTPRQIKEIEKMVVKRWKEIYAPAEITPHVETRKTVCFKFY